MTARRALLTGIAAVLATPELLAQAPRPLRKMGYLHPRTIAPTQPTLALLRVHWQKLGYVEGETVLLRSANDDLGRVPGLIKEMEDQGVGAVIVVGGPALSAARRATNTLPLVAIDLETDPVRAGFAASFARPGGNVTGLFMDQPSIAGKWIDLLRDAAPQIRRLAFAWDPAAGSDQLEIGMVAGRSRGLDAIAVEVGGLRDFDPVFRKLAGNPRTGIVHLTAPGFASVAEPFAVAARRHGLPTISFLKVYARAGILMTYGPVQDDYYVRAAAMADRILKGARPGDMPIEGPDRFEFAINLGTAKALGLSIPQSLLLRADEVIA